MAATTRLSVLVMALALAIAPACGKKNDDGKNKSKPAAKVKDNAPAPKAEPVTGEKLIAAMQTCFAAFDAENAAKFGDCYAEKSVSRIVDHIPPMENSGRKAIIEQGTRPFWDAFTMKNQPRVIATSGNKIVAINLVEGINDGALPGGVPATNKPVGLWIALWSTVDDNGKIVDDYTYFDQQSLVGQMGLLPEGMPFRALAKKDWDAPELVVAKGDDTEKANLVAYQAWLGAINSGDAAAVLAPLTDKVAFRHMDMPADIMGKQAVGVVVASFKAGFPDMKLESVDSFAAGDWTFSQTNFSGTNTGDIPAMKLKATGKRVETGSLNATRWQDGKIVEHYVFLNGMAFASQLGLLPDPGAKKK